MERVPCHFVKTPQFKQVVKVVLQILNVRLWFVTEWSIFTP